MENSRVTEGEYKPPDCIARQSVAILIPHRSREKHLLYLMHHLHPFLQRQQIHYAIYVIQQVLLHLTAHGFHVQKKDPIIYIAFLIRQTWDSYCVVLFVKAGDATFNRAKLLNVGYLEALKDYNWECFIFHDVDLVPENDHNLYVCAHQPKHLVVGRNATGYK